MFRICFQPNGSLWILLITEQYALTEFGFPHHDIDEMHNKKSDHCSCKSPHNSEPNHPSRYERPPYRLTQRHWNPSWPSQSLCFAGIGEGTLSYDIFTINILIYIDARKKSVIMKLDAANLFCRYKENRRDRRGTDHARCGLDNMGSHTVLTGDSL